MTDRTVAVAVKHFAHDQMAFRSHSCVTAVRHMAAAADDAAYMGAMTIIIIARVAVTEKIFENGYSIGRIQKIRMWINTCIENGDANGLSSVGRWKGRMHDFMR